MSVQEGEQWARATDLDFYETSCVTGHDVRGAFHRLAARIYEQSKGTTKYIAEEEEDQLAVERRNSSVSPRFCSVLQDIRVEFPTR